MIPIPADYALPAQVEHHAEMPIGSTVTVTTIYTAICQMQDMGIPFGMDSELLNIVIRYGNNPDGVPALHYATKMGDERAVGLLLDHGASPLSRDHHNISCLRYAVESGKLNLVRKFVDLGCDINEEGNSSRSPFIFAIYKQKNEIAKYLFSIGAEAYPGSEDYDFNNAITACCSAGNYDMLTFLIGNGVKVITPLPNQDPLEGVLWNCLCGAGTTPNQSTEKLKCLTYLVDKRLAIFPVNADAYYQMLGNTYPEALEYVLENRCLSPNDCFVNGCPVLFYAASNSNFGVEFAEILLKKGADVRFNGGSSMSVLQFIAHSSPLKEPDLKKKKAVFSLLIRAGADTKGVLSLVRDSRLKEWLIASGVRD